MGELSADTTIGGHKPYTEGYQGKGTGLTSDRLPYETEPPEDAPVNGTTRVVFISGIAYLYVRAGDAWHRIELSTVLGG